MSWWIWIVAGLCLAGLEALLGGELYLLFFGAAGVLVGALTALGVLPAAWMQLAAFSVAAVGVALPLRNKISERLKARIPSREIDATVGAEALVLDTIAPGDRGKAELRGSPWTAENVGEAPLAAGQRAVVERLEGLTLFLRGR
ncbi:MAG: NfeD family protein [Acidobacteria bacterium]|nr:NfeD family protein [Acidobacteriota bacterium]